MDAIESDLVLKRKRRRSDGSSKPSRFKVFRALRDFMGPINESTVLLVEPIVVNFDSVNLYAFPEFLVGGGHIDWLQNYMVTSGFTAMARRFQLFQIDYVQVTFRRAIADFVPGVFGTSLVSIVSLPTLKILFNPVGVYGPGQIYNSDAAMTFPMNSDESTTDALVAFPTMQPNNSIQANTHPTILGKTIWNSTRIFVSQSSYYSLGYAEPIRFTGPPGSNGSFPIGVIELRINTRWCSPIST